MCSCSSAAGMGWPLWEDPLLQGASQGLVLSRPIRARVGAEHRGTVYLGLSPTVITAPATGYAMDQGSALYWEMDGRLWKIEEGSWWDRRTCSARWNFTG